MKYREQILLHYLCILLGNPVQIEYDELVEGVPQVLTYKDLKELLGRLEELKPADYSKLWKPSQNLMTAIFDT